MWQLFFKKLWEWGYLVLLAWNSITGPIPTLREAMWLTLLLIGLFGLLIWALQKQIPLEEDIQRKSILWTGYPLVCGLAYYVLPRLWFWIRL
jgi:hypothetical protein